MINAPLHPDVIEFLDDQSLVEAYEQTRRSSETAEVDALLVEIQRRNLDI